VPLAETSPGAGAVDGFDTATGAEVVDGFEAATVSEVESAAEVDVPGVAAEVTAVVEGTLARGGLDFAEGVGAFRPSESA
jgi:hypothetical protein